MKLGKLLLAVMTATVLLGALVASASAGRLNFSSTRNRTSWTRLDFRDGFSTVECEVVLEGTLRARSIAKSAGALVGYVTAANVSRCARGGATINRETLPWHDKYASFTGTLPAITTVSLTILGFSTTIRDSIFGINCSVTVSTPSLVRTYTLSGGVVTGGSLSATGLPCGMFSIDISGSTVNVDNGSGPRITIILI